MPGKVECVQMVRLKILKTNWRSGGQLWSNYIRQIGFGRVKWVNWQEEEGAYNHTYSSALRQPEKDLPWWLCPLKFRGRCLNAHSNMGTIAIVPLPMFTWSKFDIGQLDFMADVWMCRCSNIGSWPLNGHYRRICTIIRSQKKRPITKSTVKTSGSSSQIQILTTILGMKETQEKISFTLPSFKMVLMWNFFE